MTGYMYIGPLLIMAATVRIVTALGINAPEERRSAMVAGGVGATLAAVFVVGPLLAVPVGFLYALGCRGWMFLMELCEDSGVGMAYGLLSFLLCPLHIVLLPFERRQRAELDRQRALVRGYQLWREEFRQSGATDASTFQATNPAAVRPPDVGRPLQDETPTWHSTARLGGSAAVRRMHEYEQRRARREAARTHRRTWFGRRAG